ncbi:MAG: PHP domain-containing protein [Oscillospiraceae bacterium]|nr:PHP domain-containing protein [Oscillospiraceae bacterium]
MFKTETHLHVSEVSPCAKLSAAEMVRRYTEAGYHTVFVADHLYQGYFDILGERSWEEKVDCFLSGYRAAKEASEGLPVRVLLSAELMFENSCNHYLLYGIDEAFLKARDDLFSMTIESFYPYAKEKGVTVVQAHPFRNHRCYPTFDFVDGVEVENANPRSENHNDEALALAEEYGLPMTGGSDAHRMEDVANSGVCSQEEICSAADYVRLLLANELRVIRKAEEDDLSDC